MKFQITKTEINSTPVETVSARDIHQAVESKQDFSTWIKNRIKQGGFVEDQDFIKLHEKMELSTTGQVAVQYHITTDMAKHLGMMERNEKGKAIRQFFIEREKETNPLLGLSPAEQLLWHAQRLVDQERRMTALAEQQAETHAQVQALVNGEDYMTVVGYGNLMGHRFDMATTQKIGKAATAICKENGWNIGKARHPLFGAVNTYPRDAIEQALVGVLN